MEIIHLLRFLNKPINKALLKLKTIQVKSNTQIVSRFSEFQFIIINEKFIKILKKNVNIN